MGKPKAQPQLPATVERPQLPTTINERIYDMQAAAAPLAPVMSLEDAGVNFERTKAFIANNLSLKSGDIYVLPTSPKPVLAKSGAEKLAAFFSCVPEYELIRHIENWYAIHPQALESAAPYFLYEWKCRLKWRANGLQVGEGVGVCHSWESRYLWRDGQRTCPVCGKATIMESKPEWGGGFYCNKKIGGCHTAFKEFASKDYKGNHVEPTQEDIDIVKVIREQQVGRMVNPNLGDSMNTVSKISQKRSLAPAVITALGIGGLFTQDLEDWSEYDATAAGSARTATEDALKTMREMGILNPDDAIEVEHREVTGEQETNGAGEAKQEAEKKPSSPRSPRSRTKEPKPSDATNTGASAPVNSVTNGTTTGNPTNQADNAPNVGSKTAPATATPTPTPGTQDTPTTTVTPPNGAATGAVRLTEPPAEPTPDEIAAMMSAKANGNYNGDDLKTCLNAQFGVQPSFNSEMCRWVTGYMTKFPLNKAAASVK